MVVKQDKFKLIRIIDNFIEETNMQWNHQDWLSLLSKVERAGYKVNPNDIGLMIERERDRRRISK